jgi:hypothetical protein
LLSVRILYLSVAFFSGEFGIEGNEIAQAKLVLHKIQAFILQVSQFFSPRLSDLNGYPLAYGIRTAFARAETTRFAAIRPISSTS